MSENLKRAESLFNRIMNQSGSSSSHTSSSSQNHVDAAVGAKTNSYQPHHKSYSNSNSNSHSNTSRDRDRESKYKSNGVGSSANVNALVTANAALLPKRDPIKSSQETLSRIPPEHHILPYCWTVWHHSRSRLKQKETSSPSEDENSTNAAPAAAAVDSYLQTTNEIEFLSISGEDSVSTTKSIGSLEQLWMSLSSIKKTYELPIGTELLIFKSGINPVWEDPINTKGGRWVFRFNRRSNGSSDDHDSIAKIRKRTSLIWERLVIKTITGSIIPEANNPVEYQDLLLNDISGLVLSVRKDEDIISIWNSNLNFGGKGKKDDDKSTNKKLTSFQARRVICDAILRVIRECDLIAQGSDCVDTVDTGSNERVYGVSFEYRLHADNANPDGNNGSNMSSSKYGSGHHHHHHNSHNSHHHHHSSHHNRRYNNNNSGSSKNSYNTVAVGGSSGDTVSN
ncbi:hypothetical protein G9P44_002606 [Scheffersomyces stipitis]|nr:hypothetical protein G9P44_002606 [Scheffersomyces stipitis]